MCDVPSIVYGGGFDCPLCRLITVLVWAVTKMDNMPAEYLAKSILRDIFSDLNVR